MPLKLIDDKDVIVYREKCLVIPNSMRHRLLQWCHHYLMQPGHMWLEKTLKATMYWETLYYDVRGHIKESKNCQKGENTQSEIW